MAAGISVRRLTPTDGGAYRALMLRGYSEHDTAFTSTFEERATKQVEWWTRRLQDPTTVTLGAFDAGDSLIGTARLEAYQRTRERHKVTLTAMYVMKDHANGGVGRKILDEALVEFEDVVFLDRQYIEQWTLWLDFSILLRTIPAVLRRDGAY